MHDQPLAAEPAPIHPPVVTDVPAPSRARGLSAAAALAALLLLGFVLEARVWLRTTSAEDYAAAEAIIRPEFKPGDAVTVAPAFALRALERLGDLRGVGSTWVAEGLGVGIRTLWVVAEPGADAWLDKMRSHYRQVDERRAGSLRVFRFDVAAEPRWHAATDIRNAEVRLHKRGGPSEGVHCATPHTRLAGFVCAGEPDWQRTTVEWMDLAGHQSGGEVAVWAHPPSGGDFKTITWRSVNLGPALLLGAGHTEHGARGARSPVDIQVKVAGRVVGTFAFAPHHGLTLHRMDLPADLVGPQDVEVTLSARDNAASHFAVDLGVAR